MGPADTRHRSWIFGALALGLASTAAAAQQPAYLDHDGLTRELRALANGSDRARLRAIGTSVEDREIWLLEIGDPAGMPLDARPGLLVVGNLSGDHLLGSALALAAARHLLTSSDSAVADVLATRVVYVVPRLNPDAAQAMFGRVRADRVRNARPVDDDNDGRVNEDPGEDLNGDGLITVMRVRDPAGAFRPDPKDARIMKRADPSKGESGGYALYIEGRDSDGDGYLNEDGPGGVDLDRNFQHAYPYWQADAGPHMVSEPETRALMDFVIARDNIAAILTFGHSDNLVTPPDARGNLADPVALDLPAFARSSFDDILEQGVFRTAQPSGFGGFFFGGGGREQPRLRGAQPGRDNDPSSGRRPATSVHRDDLTYFSTVSDAYREVTGITRLARTRKPEGAFFEYGYFQFGVPSFSTAGWGLPTAPDTAATDAREPGADARPPQRRAPSGRPAAGATGARRSGDAQGADATILAAMDGAGIDAFVPWAPFDHPDLGSVEIGGFRPYAVTNPPPDRLADLGRAHGAFVARLAGMLPRVRIADTEVTNHGGGVFTVAVVVENAGYFPTALQHGIVSGAVDATTVQIQVPPEAVLTGADKTATIRRLDGSGGRERIAWVIRGRAGASVEIRVLAQKGGTASTTVTLR